MEYVNHQICFKLLLLVDLEFFFYALVQIETEKLLAQLVETEMNRRLVCFLWTLLYTSKQ